MTYSSILLMLLFMCPLLGMDVSSIESESKSCELVESGHQLKSLKDLCIAKIVLEEELFKTVDDSGIPEDLKKMLCAYYVSLKQIRFFRLFNSGLVTSAVTNPCPKNILQDPLKRYLIAVYDDEFSIYRFAKDNVALQHKVEGKVIKCTYDFVYLLYSFEDSVFTYSFPDNCFKKAEISQESVAAQGNVVEVSLDGSVHVHENQWLADAELYEACENNDYHQRINERMRRLGWRNDSYFFFPHLCAGSQLSYVLLMGNMGNLDHNRDLDGLLDLSSRPIGLKENWIEQFDASLLPVSLKRYSSLVFQGCKGSIDKECKGFMQISDITADGRYLICAGHKRQNIIIDDGFYLPRFADFVLCFDVIKKEVLKIWYFSNLPTNLSISPDGNFALICFNKCKVRDWMKLPEEQKVLTTGEEGYVMLLNLKTGEGCEISSSPVLCCWFNASGDSFFIWDSQNCLKLYDIGLIVDQFSCSEILQLSAYCLPLDPKDKGVALYGSNQKMALDKVSHLEEFIRGMPDMLDGQPNGLKMGLKYYYFITCPSGREF